MHAHVCHCPHVEARGQLVGFGFSFLQGSNWSHQTWWQGLIPEDPSQRPSTSFLETVSLTDPEALYLCETGGPLKASYLLPSPSALSFLMYLSRCNFHVFHRGAEIELTSSHLSSENFVCWDTFLAQSSVVFLISWSKLLDGVTF